MSAAPSFQKAELRIELDPTPLAFRLNPKDFTLAKANGWQAKAAPGVGLPPVTFGGGQPMELSFEMLLDDDEGTRPVDRDLDRLFKAMAVDERTVKKGKKNSGRPPYVTFAWGANPPFTGAIQSLSVAVKRFTAEGRPAHAVAQLKLMQVEPQDTRRDSTPAKGQNPTTRAIGALGTHVVRTGDSLQSIAWEAYGDPTRWRGLARANGIDDPTRLRAGAVLAIPGDAA